MRNVAEIPTLEKQRQSCPVFILIATAALCQFVLSLPLVLSDVIEKWNNRQLFRFISENFSLVSFLMI